jgi:hypothetical protein
MTQCLVIERYNRIYFFDQPERVENSRFCVLRTAVGTALPVDLPSLASFLCCDPSLITQATPNVPTARAKRACSSTLKTKEQQQQQQQQQTDKEERALLEATREKPQSYRNICRDSGSQRYCLLPQARNDQADKKFIPSKMKCMHWL